LKAKALVMKNILRHTRERWYLVLAKHIITYFCDQKYQKSLRRQNSPTNVHYDFIFMWAQTSCRRDHVSNL